MPKMGEFSNLTIKLVEPAAGGSDPEDTRPVFEHAQHNIGTQRMRVRRVVPVPGELLGVAVERIQATTIGADP